MDDRQVRTLIIKQNRRSLLDTLKLVYPAALSLRSLCEVLPQVERHYLKTDIAYLLDKGYLVWTNERPSMAWDGREYKLTAEGVERADAIILDPALEP